MHALAHWHVAIEHPPLDPSDQPIFHRTRAFSACDNRKKCRAVTCLGRDRKIVIAPQPPGQRQALPGARRAAVYGSHRRCQDCRREWQPYLKKPERRSWPAATRGEGCGSVASSASTSPRRRKAMTRIRGCAGRSICSFTASPRPPCKTTSEQTSGTPCLVAIPPQTPTPMQYIQPCVKSNRCELASDPITFCATSSRPSQDAMPPPQKNSEKCEIHMANSNNAPTNPSWIATANV